MNKSEIGAVKVGSKVGGTFEKVRYEGRIKALTANPVCDPNECFATVKLDFLEPESNTNKLRLREEITVPLMSLELLSSHEPMSYWFGCRVSESRTDWMPGIWQPDGPYNSHEEAIIKQRDAHEPDMQVSEIFQAKSHAEAVQYLLRKS